jgi:short subunit dehydrogenase-like uncharacterized protein
VPGPLVIYGAYGYTGALVARRAVDRGLPVVLAGRDSERLAVLAGALRCEWRAFPLVDPAAIRRGIDGAAAVLHCAGPFVRTFRPMVEACLEARVHYLDLTGEIPVFRGVAELGPHAERAGVMLLPGAGFDVVPTDCLAAHLVRRLPGATRIALALEGLERMSIGTARTMTGGQAATGAGGRKGPFTRPFDFGEGPVTGYAIPWGDVFTAPRSTGVGDVSVYAVAPLLRRLVLAGAVLGATLVRIPVVQEGAARLLAGGTSGPDASARARGRTRIVGEAEDASGRKVIARQRGPEAYALTALAAVEIAERVLRGEVKAGWQTPASAFGPDLVLALPGVEREDVI